MNVGTLHQKIMERYVNDRPALMLVDSYAYSIIAAEVASLWGLRVTDSTFYNHDVKDVVAGFDQLSAHEKALLEWAIVDNIYAYRAWMTPNRQTMRTATLWSKYRPAYLNPMRYKFLHPIAG